MTPVIRSFYTRLHLLTHLLPAYLLALLSYGAAWLFTLSRQHPGLAGGGFVFYGFFLFMGLSRLLSAAGLFLSGIPRARVEPDADEAASLAAALAPPGTAAPFAVQLVETGAVPFAAAGGLLPGEIWISRHALHVLPPPVLRAILLHEGARTSRPGWGCAWQDLSWALAFPIAYLLSASPLFILVAAALHVSLWLHFELWLDGRAEARADRSAAEMLGRLEYARALAEYLRLVVPAGRERFILQRLMRLGASAEEIAEVLKGVS